MVDTTTRPEFDLAAYFGLAGQAADLTPATVERWRTADPVWKGKHWVYSDPDEYAARRLRPINVAPRAKTQD